ncbi:MAG: acetyl/propionyl/methylcrotonyl-CoA carboxylase subunit alpha [Reyranella sp.]|uniref:acetyl/propionyl/methylcrotonyl-CoA carboxylase subunit alpha n=1 Tax=Reyranella sp. TaxID=1929291 RepID=UPI00122135B0|nr:acetyl/propionyl/methylcrotonyl-CoA carboxylase subunit alpha [Reyranella sp.]TAJ89044.1 MAG: acetyl/propionyl/methylcrotonyl-CoA carboxylase subunit alpha [Reyranella sp.]
MFTKILIANRGEIACRVIKTAKRLGIKTVAVYSDADRNARHVAMADEAVHIGPPAARESYLVADRIIDAAKRTGAQAVHPGYGFLSENAGFADACAAAGIVFIGPPAASIRAMGSKSEAKKIMEKAGVPLVPGYHGDDQSPELLAREAAKICFPVLIKASAGGGGKGMRVVESAEKFADALAGAKREAKASFADDHVLVEKYLTRPRHIEIQVFADASDCLYLFERDCSLQRRHQKVIEEAPAPNMDPARRRAMGEAAVAAAKAIGYRGAGTVEFIADQDGTFFFMEMNTRLQVEHPVTEAITGQDLVEWQLIVAAGGKMPLTQDELRIDGHAVEVRLYAEDPARNFLPSTGTLVHLKLPEEGAHVRVDTGVRQGDTVTPFYDPMIAKVIVHDRDRISALRRMAALMGETEVVGVTTNAGLLKALCSHPAFVSGEVDTGFIERHRATLFAKPAPAGDRAFAVATLARLLEWQDAAKPAAGDPWSPWNEQSGFRLLDDGHEEVRWKDGEREVVVLARRLRSGGLRLELPGGPREARVQRLEDGRLSIGLGEDTFLATVVRRTALDGGADYTLFTDRGSLRLRLVDPLDVMQYEATASADAMVRAPLPGKIIDLRVKAGDTVSKGQALLVLEAMKMEHTLAAPADGTVKNLRYAVGEQVPEGAELVEFE